MSSSTRAADKGVEQQSVQGQEGSDSERSTDSFEGKPLDIKNPMGVRGMKQGLTGSQGANRYEVEKA
jgi:hypothetical protein